jgi:hypothetical protein
MQLIMSEGDPAGRPGPGQAHQVFRSDVRREDRCPDHNPAEIAAGKKIVVSGIAIRPDDPPREGRQHTEVRQDDQPVESRHTRSVTFLRATMRTVGPLHVSSQRP